MKLPRHAENVVLLAVDLGLRSGLAGFDTVGVLVMYRSRHFSSRKTLKQAAYSICNDFPNLTTLVIEGGGELAAPWEKEASRRNLTFLQVSADEWREDVLLQREQRSGKQAKQVAMKRALDIIHDSGMSGPTSLKHDTAEAILMGYWVTGKLGWRT